MTFSNGGNWTLVSSHGLVLFYLASHPDSTIRQVAAELDLTERRVISLVRDLENAGLIRVFRLGRRNRYEVNSRASFRHPILRHIPIGSFVSAAQREETRQLAGSV